MTVTPPPTQSPPATNSRPGEPLLVQINGQECPDIHVLSIDRSVGGRGVDHAILAVALNSHRDPQVGPLSALLPKGLLNGFNVFDLLSAAAKTPLFVMVFRPNDLFPLHWGVISGAQIVVGQEGDTLQLVSRLEPYLVGPKRLMGIETPRIGQFSEDAVQIIDEPIVFNPIQDGRVRPNRGFDSLSGNPYKAFIDPDSAATENAWNNNNLGDPPAYWTISEVLLYLCWRANPNETYVKNPTEAQLVEGLKTAAFNLAASSELVRNLGVRDGSNLFEALDQVCAPLSIYWWVEPLGGDIRELRFLVAGGTAQTELELSIPDPAAPSWKLDAGRVLEAPLDVTIAEQANSIEVVCDYLYVESDFALGQGWSDDDIPDNLEDLREDSEAWKNDPKLRRVYRLFVADYFTLEGDEIDTATLPEIQETVQAFFKFSDHYVGDEKVSNNLLEETLDWKVARRGRFYPTITLGDDGNPIGTDPGGVLVEYAIDEDANGDPVWEPLRDLLVGSGCEIQLLDNQFGIYIAGTNPPWGIADLYSDPDHTPIFRVIASIRSDRRARVTNDPEKPYTGAAPTAPDDAFASRQPLPIHHLEDAGRRFQYRAVHRDSPFFEKLEAGDLSADVVNDIFPTEFSISPAQRAAKQLLEWFDCAKLRGQLVLDGLDSFLGHLGDACPFVLEGRQIGLYGAAASGVPRIIAINIQPQQQRIRLLIETQPAVAYQSPWLDPAGPGEGATIR